MDENKKTDVSAVQTVQTETKTDVTQTNSSDGTAIQSVPLRERLKSPAVWAAVFGALAVILNAFGVFDKLGIDSAEFDAIVNSVGSVLIAFGILNNPTDRTNF